MDNYAPIKYTHFRVRNYLWNMLPAVNQHLLAMTFDIILLFLYPLTYFFVQRSLDRASLSLVGVAINPTNHR